MQRLRVLLLGKGEFIEVQNPSVQLEPRDSDFSPAEAAEHLERQKSIEEDVIVSQDVTSEIILGANEDVTAHLEVLEDLETIYLTQKEIDEKLENSTLVAVGRKNQTSEQCNNLKDIYEIKILHNFEILCLVSRKKMK